VAMYSEADGLTLEPPSTRVWKRKVKRQPRVEVPLPKDWKPTPSHVALALQWGLDCAREAETFRDHAETHGRKAVLWDAAFRMWLRKANDYRGVASTPGRGYSMQEL